MKRLLYLICLAPHLMCTPPWQYACDQDNVPALKALVEKDKAIIRLPDEQGHLPIHIATYKGSIKVVKFLLETDETLLNALDENKNIPFSYIFAGAGDLRDEIELNQKMFVLALNIGILKEVEQSGKPSTSTLPLLIFDGQKQKNANYHDLIKLFISKGANFNIKNTYNMTWKETANLNPSLQAYVQYADDCIKEPAKAIADAK
jgi:ankyrin repeat protein